MLSLRRAAIRLLIALIWAHAHLANAASSDEAARWLFEGSGDAGVTAQLAGGQLQLPASRFPCRNCHGADGMGAREGNLDFPPIAGAALVSGKDGRPVYDASALARLLSEGVTPLGRTIAAEMPRYPVSEALAGALLHYLQTLHDSQRGGIAADQVHIGVDVSGNAGPTFSAAFSRTLLDLAGERGFHGRLPHLRALDGDVEGTPAVDAFLKVGECVAGRGAAPCLFGGPWLEEDTHDLPGLGADAGQQLEALAEHARARGLLNIAIGAGSDRQREVAARALLAHGLSIAGTGQPHDALLLFGLPGVEDLRGQTVYAHIDLAAALLHGPGPLPDDVFAIDPLPALTRLALERKQARAAVFGEVVAQLVARGLINAGRGLTHARFLDGMRRSHPAVPLAISLDYARYPRMGDVAVRIHSLLH